jgi:hypothetical protein
MIEQPPPPDKRIVRPPCRVSPDLPGVQRQSDLTAQPSGSLVKAVLPVHAATGRRGADRLVASAGLQVLFVLVQRRGRVLAPT